MQFSSSAIFGVLNTYIVGLVVLLVTHCRGEQCEQVQRRCISRLGCSMALQIYFTSCGRLLNGETTQCNTRCQQAIISLLTADMQDRPRQGDMSHNLINCDCGDNNFCQANRRRVAVCSDDVLPAMATALDDTTQISCSLSELICRADSACLTALQYYESNCGKLWRGQRCTPECNNSLSILYRQPQAKKLRTCQCDGSEGYPVACHVIQENTERLCFSKDKHSRGHRHRHRHRHSSPAPTTLPYTPEHSLTTTPTHKHDTINVKPIMTVKAQRSTSSSSTLQTLSHWRAICTLLFTALLMLPDL